MFAVPTSRWHASISLAITPTKNCPDNARVREFSDVILSSFGVKPGPPTHCTDVSVYVTIRCACADLTLSHITHVVPSVQDDTTVLFVRRVHYKAHPRHSGKLEVRIANEDEILTALEAWAAQKPGVCACVFSWYMHIRVLLLDLCGLFAGRRILNGMFHEMTIAQQLEMVQQSCVILAAHGCRLVTWRVTLVCVDIVFVCAERASPMCYSPDKARKSWS